MISFPVRPQKRLLLLLALLAPIDLPAQTTINVNGTVIQSPVKRFGINLGTPNYYDSGQMTKNLVFTNPSFEGEIYQSTIECGAATASSCTDANYYSGFTGGFWNYASYTVISGGAKGRSGTVCSYTPSSTSTYPNGGTFTFCDSGTAPSQYDYIVVKTTLPANVGWPDGDWLTVVGGGTFSAETNDLPPGTLGKQSGLLTAATGNDSISVNMFFDSTPSRSFLQLNGPFQLTFLAKGVSGNQNIAVGLTRGTATFISQTIPLTNSWAPYTINFTGNENGTGLGKVKLSFTAAGPDTVELDDVSLMKTGTDPTNTTVFRDEVVQALQNTKPGVVRYWLDQLGEPLDNLLIAPTGRQRTGYTPYSGYDGEIILNAGTANAVGTFQTQSVKVGLTEFLVLCQKVGADPWIVVPSTFGTGEAYGLMDYLAGPSSSHYGGIRAAAGQSAPWTSVFNVIHLEFGNEEWNGGTFKGGAIETGVAYGQAASTIFAVIKNHPNYVQSSFDLIVDGQSTNPGGNHIIQENITNNDSFSIAPYMMYNLDYWDTNDHLFGTTFAEAEAFVTPGASAEGVGNGFILAEQSATGKPIVTSEMNLSPTGDTGSSGDGPMPQNIIDGYASSVGGGIAVLDSMFQQLRAGVLTQNLFALSGYDVATTTGTTANLWGAVVDMGVTNRKRPQYLALQMANQAIGSNTQMLQTTQTGTNPTDNQYNFMLNSVSLPTFHFIQSFAFTGSGTNSVVVFNASPDYAEPINFAGTNAPTGTVNIVQLTSAHLTDTNETSAVVAPTSNTVSNFNPSSQISLPPYSMTVFSWGNLSQQSQTITFNNPGNQTVGTPLTLTGTASSGLTVTYSSSTTSICMVSGSSATFLAPGTCTITASQAGNSSYSAATLVAQSFTVTSPSQSQTITFGTIATQTVGTPLTLVASASSGLPVSFASNTTSVCTVSGTTATFLAGGTCSITASQAGNSTYSAAAPVTQTFTVAGPQTITFGTIATQTVGTPLTLTATASSGLPVSYSSSTTAVCTVSGSTATFLAGGTCSITASQPGNSTFTAAIPVTQSFSVLKTQTITFGVIATQTVGTPLTLVASASSGLTVSFASTTTSVCTVSGTTATLVAGGICSITASQAGNSIYGAAPAVTQSFSVVGPQTITFGTIATQAVGTPLTLTATASSGLPVSYSSTTPTVCTVAGSTATFVAGGTCTIIASQAGNGTVAAATPVTQSFNVLKGQTITFASIANQNVGTSLALAASASSSLVVSYSSSTTPVCTVSGNTATLITSGTCTITASQPGNSTFAPATPVTQSFTVGTPNAPNVGYLAYWGISNNGIYISWSTDVAATTQLAYGTTSALGQLTPLQPALTASHGIVLTTLNPGTTYYFVAQSTGANGATGYSTSYSFTTTGTATTPAPIISGVTSSGVSGTSATITWNTDQATSSQVSYGTSTAYGSLSTLNSSLVTSHSVTLNGLAPGTVYDFEVLSTNSSSISSTSANYTFTTTTSAPTAPVISNVVTSGITSTSVTISWTTDQATSSLVNYGTGTAYGSTSTLDTNLVTSHSVTLSGLTAGTTYDFDVVSANSSNLPATSTNSTFITSAASAGPAPYVGYVAFWGINNTGLTISWSTDVSATTQLAYGTTKSLGQLSPLQTALTASHGVVLTTLNPGTTYYFVAQSTAANGATGYSATYSFTTTGTAPSNPAPVISSVTTNGIGSTSATITWTTDQASSSQVNYGTTTGYGSSSTLSTSLVTAHSVTLMGLTAGTVYDFDVVSANSAALASTSTNYSFATTATAPVAPIITNVATSAVTSTSVTITWSTDQATSSLVNYGLTIAYGATSTPNASLVTAHSVTLTGLAAGTTYNFDVVSTNSTATPATSANATFTTATASGTAPYVGYVAYYGITNTGITVSWSTDVLATTQLAYGTSPALGQLSPLQSALSTSHGVVLNNLSPGTTYYFMAQSTNAGGVTGYSTQYSFTTTGSNLPVISGVTVVPATGNTASVNWVTAVPTYSYVQYGPAAGSYNRYSAQTSLTTTPKCSLGYVPSGLIHYQLVSTDAYGNQTMSADATFTEP